MNLRIGTFNLFQFITPEFSFYQKKEKIAPVEWEAKTQWIQQQVQTMNCDIIGFQEVFCPQELQVLLKDIGFDYFEVVDTPRKNPKDETIFTSTLVAIASKYPIKKIQEVKVHVPSIKSHHFKGHFKFSRKPIKAFISLPNGQDICCYVCHLKSNKDNEFEYVFDKKTTLLEKKTCIQSALENNNAPSLKQRLCEASSLFYDMQKVKTMPKILMCDLNDKEYSLSIDALFNKAYHFANYKSNPILKDPFYEFKPKNHNPHPEKKEEGRTPTSYFLGKGNVLDYIFVSKEFLKNSVQSYEILNDHLQKHKDGSIRTSDHAQVVCEITLD